MTDSFYFVHQPLAGNGSITVRVDVADRLVLARRCPRPSRRQSALQPWSKAGIIIKASTRPGSAYAAMMVTGGHGVRMQWDYTRDTAGLAGRRLRGVAALAAADPFRRHHHRLRLGRRQRTGPGSAPPPCPGWPATVQAGLFAASPASSQLISQSVTGSSSGGQSTQATAAFDHVSLQGTPPGSRWTGTEHRRRP